MQGAVPWKQCSRRASPPGGLSGNLDWGERSLRSRRRVSGGLFALVMACAPGTIKQSDGSQWIQAASFGHFWETFWGLLGCPTEPSWLS